MSWLSKGLTLSLLFCAFSVQAYIAPYLQNMTATSATLLFEDSARDDYYLTFGTTRDLELGKVVPEQKGHHPRAAGKMIYHIGLQDLATDTEYFYQLHTKWWSSKIHSFKTFPAEEKKKFKFIAYSDSQRQPEIHENIVNEIRERHFDTAFILVPGDLVHVGAESDQYKDRFLGPSSALNGKVPYFPALGNHEYQGLDQGEAPLYFHYFDLPENGSEKYREHWYSFDYSNVKIIALDTNLGSTIRFRYHPDMHDPVGAKLQYEWLQTEMNEFCANEDLDFVFVQFHHPNYSEMWLPGNDAYSQKISSLIEDKIISCSKGGSLINGHVHSYAKGVAREARFYYVTVGTAGGLLDKWGEYENRPSPFIEKNISSYGFVTFEVEAGDDPKFSIKRFGKEGSEFVKEDEFSFQLKNKAPKKPQILKLANKIKLSSYQDPENDPHYESEWTLVSNEDKEVRWIRVFDDFNGVPVNQEDLLKTFNIPKGLGNYQIKLRVRDNQLNWSESSDVLK